jgi:uncharacterized protein YjbI with pentapeptide repeats
LKKAKFTKCNIVESDFINCDLSESDFSESEFKDTIFNNVNLQKANFYDAFGYSINPLNNKVAKAVFSLPAAISLVEHLGVIIK